MSCNSPWSETSHLAFSIVPKGVLKPLPMGLPLDQNLCQADRCETVQVTYRAQFLKRLYTSLRWWQMR